MYHTADRRGSLLEKIEEENSKKMANGGSRLKWSWPVMADVKEH